MSTTQTEKIMKCATRELVFAGILVAMLGLTAARVVGQEPDTVGPAAYLLPPSALPPREGGQEPGQPSSAYVLPPVEPLFVPEGIRNDPLLDRPDAPQPGVYFHTELAITGVHLTNQLSGTVTTAAGRVDPAAPPGSPLDATVSPRFELGYRLPNGAGAFGLGFRWLTTSGNGTTVGDFGPALSQHGRFNFNVADLDYHTREFSLGWFPGDEWDFRWTFGVRAVNLYFDNRLVYPATVATPDAVTAQRETNGLNAFGPHVALDLHRRFLDCLVPGLAFGGRIDYTDLFGRIRQRFIEDLNGGVSEAASSFGRFETSAEVFQGQIGFSYTLPKSWNKNSFLFLGYQHETWWHIGRLSNQATPNAGGATNSRAQLELDGFILRAEFNY
jgi:hypothetical protein